LFPVLLPPATSSQSEISCKYADLRELWTGDVDTQGSIHSRCDMIDLSYQGIGSDAVARLAKAMVTTEVHTLSLHSNQIGDEGAEAIAELLRNSGTLTTLVLAYNGLTPHGVEIITQAIPSSSLETLSLAGNAIGPVGASYVANLLADSSTRLQHLDLAHCGVGTVGAVSLAQSIAANPGLRTLELSQNGIRDSAVKFLMATGSLRRVGLASNHIGATGAQHVAQALSGENTLRTLHLSGNPLQGVGVDAIAQVMQVNTAVTQLEIEDVQTTDADQMMYLQKIQSALNRNIRTCLELTPSDFAACGIAERQK